MISKARTSDDPRTVFFRQLLTHTNWLWPTRLFLILAWFNPSITICSLLLLVDICIHMPTYSTYMSNVYTRDDEEETTYIHINMYTHMYRYVLMYIHVYTCRCRWYVRMDLCLVIVVSATNTLHGPQTSKNRWNRSPAGRCTQNLKRSQKAL